PSPIDRYAQALTDKLQQVVLEALADRKPARLGWNEGKVGFARNRRTPGGPVDQALPILCVTSLDGNVRAVVANYACHCTTLGGDFNRFCGDWAGFVQEAVHYGYPDAIDLNTSIIGAAS